MTKLRPVLAAAGLLAGGLALASPALACPGAKKAPPPPALAAGPTVECGYANSHRASCCGASFGTQLLAAGVPAGLVAFGLGWLTGGRRRRNEDQA